MSFLFGLVMVLAQAPDDLIVERVEGSDPPRVTVRCAAASARKVLLRTAEAAGLDPLPIPTDLDGLIGPVYLREASPDEIVELVAGAIGYVGRVERGRILCDLLPSSKEEGSRKALRDEAVAQYERFLTTSMEDSRAPRAWLELAALHHEARDLSRAIDVLRAMRETVVEGEARVRSAVHLGYLYFLAGQYESAMEVLLEITEKNSRRPEAGDAYYLLGRCRLALDAPELAHRYFAICRQSFPTTEAAVFARIWSVESLRRTGDTDEAWREIATLEMMPLSTAQALDLLEVRTAAADAAAEFREAAEGWLALAAAATEAGIRKDRIQRAARAAERSGDALLALFTLITARPEEKGEIIGRFLMSCGASEAAVKFKPTDPSVRVSAALELLARNEIAAAQKMIESAPEDGELSFVRKLIEADVALRGGRPALVPELLTEAILRSGNEKFVGEAMQRLGESYLMLGNLERAEMVFKGIIPPEGWK